LFLKQSWKEALDSCKTYSALYLKGTINTEIIYKGNNCEFKVYTDADFANDKDNRKSISGYISVLANAQ